MEQKKQGKNEQPDRRLPVLGGALLLGALAGSLMCARWEGLQSALLSYGQAPATLWSALWFDLALLCGLLLCGWLRSGCLLSLLLMGVKGCALSLLSAVNLLGQGSAGFVQTLSVALLPVFFSLAALLLVGRQAMALSLLRQRSRKPIVPDSAYWLTFVICLGLLLFSAGLTVWLGPRLWGAVQTLL